MKRNISTILLILIFNALVSYTLINFNISFETFFILTLLSLLGLYLTVKLSKKVIIKLHKNYYLREISDIYGENKDNYINIIYNLEQSIFVYFFTILFSSLHFLMTIIYFLIRKNYLYSGYVVLMVSITLGIIIYLNKYKKAFSLKNYYDNYINIKLAGKEEKEYKLIYNDYKIFLKRISINTLIMGMYLGLGILGLYLNDKNILLCIVITGAMLGNYKKLGMAYRFIKDYKNSKDREKGKEIKDFKDSIVIKDVSYRNLNNINIKLEKNTITMIYGSNMTGKSTILDILAGEVIVDKGTVLVDNEEVMNRKLRVSYMRYDDYLFSNTIKNMFLELNRNTNETRIHFWLKQANAEYFTYNLQKLIVNNGSNLNSEEKNKLKIALNLVKNSNILLFDEPFKYLDSTSVKRIMTNLRYLNKTIVITTNEERDLVYADKVYELDKGNARERKDYHD